MFSSSYTMGINTGALVLVKIKVQLERIYRDLDRILFQVKWQWEMHRSVQQIQEQTPKTFGNKDAIPTRTA
jgi:hypothetical protein